MAPCSPALLLPAALPSRPVAALRSLQMAGNRDRQALSGHWEEKEERCSTSMLPIDGPLTSLCFNNCTFIIPKTAKLPPSLSFALGALAQSQHFLVPVHTPPAGRVRAPLLAGDRCAWLYGSCVMLTSSECCREVSGGQVLANTPVKISSVHLAEEPRVHSLGIWQAFVCARCTLCRE